VQILTGDARTVLAGLPDAYFDAVVTDPPYDVREGLGWKSWDRSGVAFDPELWSQVTRVLKPGGFLAVFGAPATEHRVKVAMEDAGLEIRDQILAWMYGQGMARGVNLERDLKKHAPAHAASAVGFHSNLKPAHEPIILARKPPSTTNLWGNWLEHGTGALNIDATRVATDDDLSRIPGQADSGRSFRIHRAGHERSESHAAGRFTPNIALIHRPECTDAACDTYCPVAEVRSRGLATRGRGEDASRFYPVFWYEPKAKGAERFHILDPDFGELAHETPKPLALMRWLTALITPPGGRVLDPFVGSASTLVAARDLGHDGLGIELRPDVARLAEHRLGIHEASERIAA